MSRWTRRDFGRAAVLLSAALGAPAQTLLAQTTTPPPDAALLALLNEVSQLVIPRTDTPGAGDVNTGAFVALALAHGLEGTQGAFRYDLWLAAQLDQRAGGAFMAQPAQRRAQILAALDAEAFPPGPPSNHPWAKLKKLILTGYYTSEPGGSHELNYQLIPGRWQADIPLNPGARAYSSDWTAVEFG